MADNASAIADTSANEMADKAWAIAHRCIGMTLNDENWQEIGLPKRPRIGALFQRFRAAWKPALEKRVLQHMLAGFTAAHVVAGKADAITIESIIAFYTAREDVTTAMGYSTREEGRRHLTKTIADYCKTPINDWSQITLHGIQPHEIPDKELSARLLVGCIRFSDTLVHMIPLLRTKISPDLEGNGGWRNDRLLAAAMADRLCKSKGRAAEGAPRA
jgi:hypothetical protein